MTLDTANTAPPGGHSLHPYYPPHARIPAYVPNSAPLLNILVVFAATVGLTVTAAYVLALRSRRGLRGVDCFAAGWFALCGFLHVAFEGYYVVHRHEVAGLNTLFAQLWKEYTLSDSRYLTLDTFTVCVETITVLAWGPLSLLTVFAILTAAPTRHALQLIVCTAHLYGVALYYLTNWVEGVSYSRPEFLYFWVYYVGFNLPWAIVPLYLVWDSFTEIHSAFEALREVRQKRKEN